MPASPFTTRRFSLDSIVDVEIQNSHQNFVTADGVKLAAHQKSLRYKIGDFRRKSKRPGFESSFQSKISTYMGNRFSLPVNNKIVRREPWSIGHKRRPRFGRSWVQISAKYLLNGSFWYYIICCRNSNIFLKKDQKINEKDAGDGSFKKISCIVYFQTSFTLYLCQLQISFVCWAGPPVTSPTKHLVLKHRRSMSLSDISSLLHFDLKEGMLMQKGESHRTLVFKKFHWT